MRIRRLLDPLPQRQRNQLASAVTRTRLWGMREQPGAPAILISGAPRSGTTFAAEMIADATGGRVLFEPLAHGLTYGWLRAATRPFVLHPGPDLLARIDRVLHGRLPYNHRLDHLAQRRVYRARIVKDLRLSFCIAEIAGHWPDLPILHVVRHPFDAIRSHLRLTLRVDHLTRARQRVRHLQQDPVLAARIPWLRTVRPDPNSAAQLQLFEWCATQFPVIEAARAGQVEILRYADLTDPATRMAELDRLAGHLAARGIAFDSAAPDPDRPSSTTQRPSGTRTRQAWAANTNTDASCGADTAAMFEILHQCGMMADTSHDVFGQCLRTNRPFQQRKACGVCA